MVQLAPGVASGHMNLGLSLIRQYRLPEAEQELAGRSEASPVSALFS